MSLAGLNDKVAIVTGAGGGIGAAVAQRLSDEGAKVTVVDLDEEVAAGTAASVGGETLAVSADVSAPEGVDRYMAAAVERFGRVDAVHLNAGFAGELVLFADNDVENFDRIFAVNVRGVFLGLRAAIRQMNAQGGGGSIVVTSSALGIAGRQMQGPYSASKHAVLGLARSAALDHARQGIRINALCPSLVDTNMVRSTELAVGGGDGIAGRGALESMVPLGRYARPDEMAATVAWLLSDESSYATGGTFAVDGGGMASAGPYIPPPE